MKAIKAIEETGKQLIKSPNLFPVVGIGASAGGLEAFKKLLKAIPEDSGMAYVLVQHLAPSHESMLPALLQKVTNIPVLEISDDIKVHPNHIYVLPSNKIMVATDGVLLLAPRPAKNKAERNLPIDLFFASLAEVHQSHAIGVVLSGTATDGTLGLKAIKEHGGITFAQDEASAAFDGMPHSAAQAGVVDFILPPEMIPEKLLEVVKIINGKGENDENFLVQDADIFKQILTLLRLRKGTDFTYYKQTTIRRRILRRMAINKNEDHATYVKFLKANKAEQDILYQDLLIPVTAFFRDTNTFENLCESILPLIIKNKSNAPIRIWVAGCSTGEEAYSIAICINDLLGKDEIASTDKVQIFATDISEPAIATARAGIYSKSDVEVLAPDQIKKNFTKINAGYLVNKSIRNMCVFAVHNFLKDPPFGKMDLITCRNVLIYMEPYLQNKALTTFHYALNEEGILLLGKSETTAGVPTLFVPSRLKDGRADKIYTRKNVPSRFTHITSQRSEQSLADTNTKSTVLHTKNDFQKTADDIMLRKYTPAGVVVNEAMEIIHFRGNTSNYLQQSAGKPSHNLLKMAKEGLAFELRNLLHKVKKDANAVMIEGIPIQINGALQNISIEALLLPDTIEPHYLILFHEDKTKANKEIKKSKKQADKKDDRDIRIEQLEKELAQSREDMRSITEDQEAANEELQSSNEELLSSSEELQSLNEELETGKEELQSTNEELTIINQEIISLNEQVTAAKDYAEAIILTIREPLLVLDKTLRIKTANEAFYKTFRVNESETEGNLIYDLGNKQWDIPALRTLLEKILPEKLLFNNFEVTHTFSSIGERIMLLNAREVVNKNSLEKLILLSIEDITDRKNAQEIVNKNLAHFRELLMKLPAAIYSCDLNGLINYNNIAAEKLWGQKPVIGKAHWYDLSKLLYKDGSIVPKEKMPIAILLKDRTLNLDNEFIIERPNGTQSFVLIHPHLEYNLDGEVIGVINMLFDITEQVLATKKIEESEIRFRSLADNIPMNIFILEPDEHASVSYFNKYWLNYTGQTFDEALGRAWEGIIHPDDMQAIMDIYIPALKNREAYVFPATRIKRFDGVYRWFKVQASPRFLSDGKFMGYIGISMDIEDQKNHIETLAKSEAKFRELADIMPEKVSSSDINGNVIYYNKGWLDFTGLSFDELRNAGWVKAIDPADVEELAKQWAHSVTTGEDFKMEFRLLSTTGESVWHYCHSVAIKDEHGNVQNWVAITTDIQKHKEQNSELNIAIAKSTKDLQKVNKVLEQKQQELFDTKEKLLNEYARSLIEASRDPLFTISLAGKITDLNEASAKITDISREVLKGTDFIEYFTEPDIAFKGYKKVFADGYVVDYPLTIKDGKETPVLFNGSVYKDEKGKVLGAVVVARVITEQKRFEKELMEARVFAEMATTLAEDAKIKAEIATESAENAVKSKQQFLSNMSHEIRTPMNAIIGFTKVILKTELSAKQREYLSAIKISGDALIVLINDILDLAKVDAGKMTFEKIPFRISASLSAMLHIFESKANEKNIDLVLDYDNNIPEILEGDPVRLHQIILNLISNAIKFTNTGKITVKLQLLNKDENISSIKFSVIDTGIGIDENNIETIFENFHQASSNTARLYGGTGLGLAIVKQLVEAQGGIIDAKSILGEGSTFSFTLNFNNTVTTIVQEIELMEEDSSERIIKVLVVEDIALNQLLLKTLLDDFGFDRDIASNGKVAIEKLQKKSYDIILMDLQMPEMNGFEATAYIRNTLHSNIPIIALTADVTTMDVDKCRAIGMNDYIAKPVDEKILYSKIMGLVKKKVHNTDLKSNKKIADVSKTIKPKPATKKAVDLSYLQQRTKSNPQLMMEMITLYLEQTPPLVATMKQGLEEKDWELLYASVHKMIPSFAIMGMDTAYETLAKKIQDDARSQQNIEDMPANILQLEKICTQACKELNTAYELLKMTTP